MEGNNDCPNNRRRLEDLHVDDLELLSHQIQNAIMEARRNCEIIDQFLKEFTDSNESINLFELEESDHEAAGQEASDHEASEHDASDHKPSDHEASDRETSDRENGLVEINLDNCSVRYTKSARDEDKCHSGYYVRDSVEFEEIDEELKQFSSTQAEIHARAEEVPSIEEAVDAVYDIPPQTSASARRDRARKKRSVTFADDDAIQNVTDDQKPLMPRAAPQYVLYEFPNLDRYFFSLMAICIVLALGFLWIFIGTITH